MNAMRTRIGLRTFLLIIVVLLFAKGLTSSACNPAVASPEVRVGSELDFPPYAFNDENGQIAGFSIDLIKAVADAMGLPIRISTGSWDAVWNALAAGQIDVLPIAAKLPERQLLVDFSLPHTETYDAFFVRKGAAPIRNINAARGKEIVVMRSDAAHHELVERNFQGNLILVDTIPAGLLLVASGRHDAFLCSKLIGVLSIKRHRITGLSAGPIIPDYKRIFSFAVKKGDKELLEKLNQGLLIVKTNGEYGRIYDKWLSFDDPWEKARKYLLPAIVTVIALALIAGFWVAMLKRLVNKRTRELAEKNEMLSRAYDNLEARVQERTAELAQANQLLRASEKKYRMLFDSAGDAIFIHDDKGRMLAVNMMACKRLGYTHDELMSMVISSVDAQEQGIHAQDQIDRLMEQGHIVFETVHQHKDGSPFPTEVNARLIVWNGQRAMMSICRDITERKQAEELIRKSEDKYRILFEESFDGLFITSPGGKILDMNKKGVMMFGYDTKEEILSLDLERDVYATPPDRARILGLVNTQGAAEYEVVVKKKNGETMITYCSLTAVKDESGVITSYRGIIRDITERKRAEDKIKASLLEKETMLREIHHRVKNNLQVISSLLNLQSSYLEDQKAREMFRNSMDRVKIMANIHTMLYQSADMSRVDFGGFIKDLASRLRQSYGTAESPIQVHVDAADVSLTIETSIPCGLILNELLSNALKHAFPEGKGGEINISMKSSGDRFVLAVQDNGIGFPGSIDFHNSRSLGLVLVNLLVGQISGKIDMQVDGGTKFTIAFPMARKKGQANGKEEDHGG